MVKSQSALRFERFGFALAKIFWLKALWWYCLVVRGYSREKKKVSKSILGFRWLGFFE